MISVAKPFSAIEHSTIKDKNFPTVSVVTITYGHENYIIDTLKGVLMQEYSGNIEFIIANDNSPDNTDKVIKDFFSQNAIPENLEIKYTRHQENLGMMPNFIWALKQVKGKYIALCEGDDYWVDPLKLKKQVEFLEQNNDYVLTFHRIKILKTNGSLVEDFITTVPEHYETQETLARFGNFIHTPSVLFRNIIENFPPEFLISPIGDYFLYMILTNFGKIKMLDETMAVYRYGVGILSSQTNLKLTKSFLTFYTLILSWSNNPTINQIIMNRQSRLSDKVENIIRSEYKGTFVSNHIFFRTIKSLQEPKTIWKKIRMRFNIINSKF